MPQQQHQKKKSKTDSKFNQLRLFSTCLRSAPGWCFELQTFPLISTLHSKRKLNLNWAPYIKIFSQAISPQTGLLAANPPPIPSYINFVIHLLSTSRWLTEKKKINGIIAIDSSDRCFKCIIDYTCRICYASAGAINKKKPVTAVVALSDNVSRI